MSLSRLSRVSDATALAAGFYVPPLWRAASSAQCRRGLLRCGQCDYQASLTAGTIFQDNLVSGDVVGDEPENRLGLQSILGLGSYRTAWALLHKLRAMVRPGRERLTGRVSTRPSEEGVRGRQTLKKAWWSSPPRKRCRDRKPA